MRENLPALLRTALAIVEHGAPARCVDELEISIATIYRHVDTLEQAIGYRLFARKRGHWQLLKEAEPAIETARRMEMLLAQVESELLAATPQSAGSLNLALSEDFAAHYVAPRLDALRAELDGKQINLKVSNAFADLTSSSADIAIRPHGEPGETLVGRRAGCMMHALYASRTYLERYGRPVSHRDFHRHVFCGSGHALREFTVAKWMKSNIDPACIAANFDSTVALERAVQSGVGIGVLPCFVGDSMDTVEPVMAVPKGLPVDIWVVTAAAKRNRADVKAAMKYLSDELAGDSAMFMGLPYAK